MTTKANVEGLARELCKINLEGKSVAEIALLIMGIIGDLDEDIQLAAVDRASEIKHAAEVAVHQEADKWEKLRRLTHAAGCPKDVKVFPWLKERGLVEYTDTDFSFTEKAGAFLEGRPKGKARPAQGHCSASPSIIRRKDQADDRQH